MLSVQCCRYSKSLIDEYTELLWQTAIENKLQCIGETRFPLVSVKPIPISLGIPRKVEVILLSFFYKQNLFNSFLYLAQSKKCPSPMCECGEDEQSAYHILTSCKLVDQVLREECKQTIVSLDGDMIPGEDYVSILNCSRDKHFMRCLLDIINENSLNFRTKYIIVKNY